MKGMAWDCPEGDSRHTEKGADTSFAVLESCARVGMG